MKQPMVLEPRFFRVVDFERWSPVDGHLVRRVAGGTSIRYRRTGNPATASANASNLTTQTPTGSRVNPLLPSFRVPRAHGLVGTGVGSDAGSPTGATGATGYVNAGGAGQLIDLRSIFTWRVILFVLAVGYIAGFHISLPVVGRIRI